MTNARTNARRSADTETRAHAPGDDRLSRDVARLLDSLRHPAGPHEPVQVRRLLPDGSERYAWTGRLPPTRPRPRPRWPGGR